jgi:diaminopimelate epimerase
MGNPHAIFWVDRDVWSYELDKFGPLLEHHPIFPERANISIAQVTSRSDMTLRTWERGVGLTRACGSAACAAAVSAVRTRRTDRTVTVRVPGGPLHIEWRDDDHVIMTGPAEWEWSGTLDPQTGAWQRDADDEAREMTR